jgi:DNA polymerase-3 subunit alpha
MKELIKKLKPDCFDDIIALVALFRPGPLESGMVDDYINVKHGAKAEYAHPLLEPILKPTNGVFHQEQMQITRELALYAGRRRYAAPGDGQEKPRKWQRREITSGAVAAG